MPARLMLLVLSLPMNFVLVNVYEVFVALSMLDSLVEFCLKLVLLTFILMSLRNLSPYVTYLQVTS